VTEAIYEKLFILEQQQDSLANLRDTLLPRLISGQLRLPDVVDHLGEI
jgi:type I restriction enzyme S subunit